MRSGLRRAVSAGFSMLALWTGSGCCKSYVIVETSGGELAEARPDEIRSTPTFTQQVPSIKTVTIRLPELCLQQTAAQGTGDARSSELLLRSDCAFYLSEIERVLVANGLRVISWDALVRLERSQNLSTYTAAQQLGADAVFIVNSAEAAEIGVGNTKGITLQYYSSDPLGNRLDELALDQRQRVVLKELVQQRFAVKLNSDEIVAFSATLDITAVLSATGESIWYYRKSQTQARGGAAFTRFLFRGREDNWRPVDPDIPRVANVVEHEDRRSREELTASSRGQAKNRYEKEKILLFRKVCDDFILRFRSGGA